MVRIFVVEACGSENYPDCGLSYHRANFAKSDRSHAMPPLLEELPTRANTNGRQWQLLELTKKKLKNHQKLLAAVVLWILGLTLLIIGAVSVDNLKAENTLILRNRTEKEIVYNSHNCIKVEKFDYKLIQSIDYDACVDDENLKCDGNEKCKSCTVDIEVRDNIPGEVVLGYHVEVDGNENKSRDDNQLRGNLSESVSPACAPYDRDEATGRPVAPCGALANAMYNAFKGFAKPKNWTENIWELDKNIANNNGFQNERFISWMSQDLPVKIFWRLQRVDEYAGGLPRGNYSIYLFRNYPHKYLGENWLSLYSETRHTKDDCSKDSHTIRPDPEETTQINRSKETLYNDASTACIVIGLMLFIPIIYFCIVAVKMYCDWRDNKTKYPETGADAGLHGSDNIRSRPPSPDSSYVSVDSDPVSQGRTKYPKRNINDGSNQPKPTSLMDQHCQNQPTPMDRNSQNQPTPLDRNSQNQPTPLDRNSQNQPTPMDLNSQNQPTPMDRNSQNQPTPLDRNSQNQPTPMDLNSQNQPTPMDRNSQNQPTPLDRNSQNQTAPLARNSQNQTELQPLQGGLLSEKEDYL